MGCEYIIFTCWLTFSSRRQEKLFLILDVCLIDFA